MGTWFFHAYPGSSGFDAKHAKENIAGTSYQATNDSYTGALHSNRIWNCSGAGLGQGYVIWQGNNNIPTNNARTYHIRFRPAYTGNPAGTVGIFSLGTILASASGSPYRLDLAHLTNGNIIFNATIQNGVVLTSAINAVIKTGWSPTANTVYDMQLVWDGSSSASSIKLYINGVLDNSISPFSGRSWPNPVDVKLHGTIGIGIGGTTVNTNMRVEEFAIGDGADFDLSGFTGSSRTTDIIGNAIGLNSGNTWPAVGKVVAPTTWNESGTTRTGTRVDADENFVINTHSYGDPAAQTTGDYKPTPVNKVEAGFTFGADASETGTLIIGCDYPEEDEVEDGVVYDFGNKTGTFGRHIPQTNQYFAPLEVQAEIFAVLNGDADLTTLLGANKIFDFVPDKKSFPYVTINALPFIQRDNATNDGLECEFQINVWYSPGASGQTSRGNKPVQLIQKRIDELLQQRSLCVNGWNTLQLRRTFIDILVESDNVTRQGIQRFKLFLGSKD